MSEIIQTSTNIDSFNHCLICQAEVSKRSFSSLKLCQKFLTLASRYYNIRFPDNSVNLHKTIELNQLMSESYCVQLVSCSNCSQKINSFCKIFEEVSLLQIHLNASASKITQLMKTSKNRNNGTGDSTMLECFRNQFYSKVEQNLPYVKLRRLEVDSNQPRFETDPLFIPIKYEYSDNEMDTDGDKINHSDLSPPLQPITKPRTDVTHQSKVDNLRRRREKNLSQASDNLSNNQKHLERSSRPGNPVQNRKCLKDTPKKISSMCQDLAIESPATGNTVEMLKSLPHGSLLIVHGTAEPERRHKCRFCEKTFKTRKNKAFHENVHLQRYQCRFCNKSFSFNQSMVVHERTHTGIKPFKCSLCPETFREKRACKNHIWRVHKGNGEVIQDSNNKPESNLVAAKTESLAQTKKATPNSQDAEKPFKCSICLKGFAQRQYLHRHKKLHTNPFNCDICGARFTTKANLEKHKITHTGERPYLCPVCFRTFTRHQSCKDHQRNIHKIANGVVINTKVYGVKVVPENVTELPNKNSNVTPGNQSEPKIQEIGKSECTNDDGENFILPDMQQEFEMDLKETDTEITIGDVKPVYPLGFSC